MIDLDYVKKRGLIALQYRSAVRFLASNVRAIRDERDFGHMIGVGLSVTIFGVEEDSISVHYPATWWDAFKRRWFPTFVKFKLMKPADMITTTLERGAVYPEIPATKNGEMYRPVSYLRKR
jgi:hypothetical protein